MPRFKAILLLFLATLCAPAAISFAQGANHAAQDSYNSPDYVQGQVTLDGQVISNLLGGIHAGQVLTTENGSAAFRLAPGVLLRIGANSSVEVVASGSNRTEVRLERGRANVDANQISSDALLLVDLPQGQTQILERGLYTFNAENATVRVFNGEADAFPGTDTNTDIKPIQVHEGYEVVFNGGRVRSMAFDRDRAQSDILPWTSGQMSTGSARTTYGSARPGDGYGYSSYGFYPGYWGGPYAYGYPYWAGYGWYGYPYNYGWYGYPYGYGFGLGFGYGGFYRGGFGGYYGGSYGGFRGGIGGFRPRR